MKTWSFISAAALMLVFSCCGPKEQINAGSDGNGSDVRREAPRHNAPDQDRIDSLKQAKQKERDKQ
ncbi:MAG TPA: hypothetical protein PK499_03315 [Flavobacteriales bacterium]|nr:hypothetical protein [Flavobacteriales bacterium]HPQ57686.1 hypothetical protein [Flavobacteriales bacterium]HRW90169.1 hypothetical protein [Flavobacteriales bacterium]